MLALLPQQIAMGLTKFICRSSNINFSNQVVALVIAKIPMYSTSDKDNATQDCRFEN